MSFLRLRLSVCVLVLVSLAVAGNTVQALLAVQTFDVNKKSITLTVGDPPADIAVTTVPPATLDVATEITFEVSAEGFVQIEKTATGIKITALKATDGVFVLVKKGAEAPISIKVTIKPKVEASKIRVGPPNFAGLPTNNQQAQPIRQNKPYDLALEQIEGKDAADLVKLVTTSAEALTVTPNNKRWTITGLKPGPAAVEVRDKENDALLIARLNFNVQETTQNLQFTDLNVRLKEPKPGLAPAPRPLSEVFTVRGAAGRDFSPAEAVANGNISISRSTNPNAFTIVRDNEIVPHSAGNGRFTVTSNDTQEVREFYVTVDPIASTISFKPALPIVIIGQSL